MHYTRPDLTAGFVHLPSEYEDTDEVRAMLGRAATAVVYGTLHPDLADTGDR
jgi:hypothetical protein